VLKDVTFKILPGEKVGVVGRTGAGKSSLALALFRALEAEKGKILIDDVDVGLIGLQDLRESIVMVPQDPTLFTGTVRSNLDPFSIFTDEEIFTALREVHLISTTSATTSGTVTPTEQTAPLPVAIKVPNPTSGAVTADVNASLSASTVNPASILANREWSRSESVNDTVVVMPDGPATDADIAATNALQTDNKNPFRNLNSPVTESGSNLSQGQRQLLCLARALLKAPKVLLMDEATASIDYATDAKIQETIRLIKNTTITIAHRLQTIIDYDKVLVLDKGQVIEYGDPYDLITKEGGSFRSMCETSGELDALTKTAKEAQEAKA
jgi:ABC-type multidrug transport system fused ATPase/permease subunit